MTHWIQALGLRLDPGWRRRPAAERRRDFAGFSAALASAAGTTTHCYATAGLEPDVDVMLWRRSGCLDQLEESAAAQLRAGVGRWLDVVHSFVGVTRPSPYVRRPQPQVPALFSGERARYLIVYPFTKRADWYLLRPEVRRDMMGEHIRVGRSHPEVRQLLADSFGVDDHDFLVAYETDDPASFSELVRELRATRARAATAVDTPIMLGVRRSPGELSGLLGA